MFTGIISHVGQIVQMVEQSKGVRLTISAQELLRQDVALGDSIAVNGICLTVTAFDAQQFSADVSAETLRCTTLSRWDAGQWVNLEMAATPSSRLGGHIVSGHVDAVAYVRKISLVGDNVCFAIEIPEGLAGFIAEKGSVTLDGVSLTVNQVSRELFEINCVPHTLGHTNLKDWSVGRAVNLEVDMIARYVARFLQCAQVGDEIDESFLKKHGWMA